MRQVLILTIFVSSYKLFLLFFLAYGEAFQMLTFIFDRQMLVAIGGGGMLVSRNTCFGRLYRYLFTINLSLHEMLMQI